MSDNGTAPATQKNLKELEVRLLSEIKHHFDVTVETIRHDLLGAIMTTSKWLRIA